MSSLPSADEIEQIRKKHDTCGYAGNPNEEGDICDLLNYIDALEAAVLHLHESHDCDHHQEIQSRVAEAAQREREKKCPAVSTAWDGGKPQGIQACIFERGHVGPHRGPEVKGPFTMLRWQWSTVGDVENPRVSCGSWVSA